MCQKRLSSREVTYHATAECTGDHHRGEGEGKEERAVVLAPDIELKATAVFHSCDDEVVLPFIAVIVIAIMLDAIVFITKLFFIVATVKRAVISTVVILKMSFRVAAVTVEVVDLVHVVAR